MIENFFFLVFSVFGVSGKVLASRASGHHLNTKTLKNTPLCFGVHIASRSFPKSKESKRLPSFFHA